MNTATKSNETNSSSYSEMIMLNYVSTYISLIPTFTYSSMLVIYLPKVGIKLHGLHG